MFGWDRPGSGFRLAAEALDEQVVVRVTLVEDLDGDPAPELGVLRQIDVCHSARTEPAHDPVAPVEDGVDQRILDLCHRFLAGNDSS